MRIMRKSIRDGRREGETQAIGTLRSIRRALLVYYKCWASKIPSELSEERISDLCKQIIALDESIRFAGVAYGYPHYDKVSTWVGILDDRRRNIRERYTWGNPSYDIWRFWKKLVRLHYCIGKYDRLIRATVPTLPLDNDGKGKFYLLLSFDTGSDAMSIMKKKYCRK